MPVVDASRLLEHAVRHRYAVCAFDIPDLAVLSATLAAAERARAPVIFSPGSAGVAPPEHLLPALEAAARGAAIPVVLAQHGVASLAEAARAINHGCNALIIGTGEAHSFATVARQCGIALITGAVEADLDAGESSYAGWLASGATVVIHAHLQDVAMPPSRSRVRSIPPHLPSASGARGRHAPGVVPFRRPGVRRARGGARGGVPVGDLWYGKRSGAPLDFRPRSSEPQTWSQPRP